jgi:hypothetical protein
MTVVLFIVGVVTALAVFLVVKARAGEPKRAQKWEKAAIMKQLLALSERESSASIAPIQSRTPVPDRGKRPGQSRPRPAGKISQPVRSNK